MKKKGEGGVPVIKYTLGMILKISLFLFHRRRCRRLRQCFGLALAELN